MVKENSRTSLLNTITSIIGICILVQEIILAIIIAIKLSDVKYGYGYNFGLNWGQGPVMSLTSNSTQCPIGSNYGLVQAYFPGFKSGCFCPLHNAYYPDICSIYQTSKNCTNFPESSPKLLFNWGGSLCTTRPSNTSYFSFNYTNPSFPDQVCDGNTTKSCGIADTLNSKFCVRPDQECPINYIKVVDSSDDSNSDSQVLSRGFNVTESPFSVGNKKFIWSNQNSQGKILNQFMITDHRPCADSIENVIELYQNNGEQYQCQRNISGVTYDPSWSLLDTMTIEDLVSNNGLTNQITQYPFWNNIKSRIAGLYYRNYIGLNNTCQINAEDFVYPDSPNVIPGIFNNMKSVLEYVNIN